MITTQRAKLHAPGQLVFEALDLDPDDMGTDMVFARTEFSGVSIGTEKAAWLGHPPLRAGPVYPRLMGYCNVARVERVGSAVRAVVPGDRVITHQSHQGAFVVAESAVLATLPAEVTSEAATMTYLAHLGLTALQRAAVQQGECVVVQGLGVIGLATVSVAAALGARVVAVGNDALRIERAIALGAERGVPADADELPSLAADVVVTTVGSWSGWRSSLEMVRKYGRIAVLGFPGRTEGPPPENPFDPTLFYSKQVNVLSAGQPGGFGIWGDGDGAERLKTNMRMLVELNRCGKLPLERLITHRVAWRDLTTIYELAAVGDKRLVGAVLDWSGA
jgi:threonine dehydrogenase-like Zn-dependent dehydrogenase